MHVFAAMVHPRQTRNRYMLTTEPEAMVSVNLLGDSGMSKPARPSLPFFARVRCVSSPFRSISSMDIVDQDLGAGPPWLWTDWILEEELRGVRSKRLVLIFPTDGDRWTFATLAVLLNEKSQELSLHDDPRFYAEANGNSSFSFFSRCSAILEPVAVLIKLYQQRKGNSQIAVEAERKWLRADP
jgi:hypothetical protein